jgi:quercetin dioxygenase-like cupin family protein
MPFSLNFYHDQIGAEGATVSALPSGHRLLYVRHGRAVINDRLMNVDEATYCDGPLALKCNGAWSEVWRWELAPPNVPPQLHDGAGVLSRLKMSRVITTLPMQDGTRWLFRLDQITTAAGRVADRHQHPGPGIRCLLEGAFNVQQAAESARDLGPGDAWWETGSDTVIAWGSRQMAAKFLRGMVLPVEWEGKVTGTWLSGHLPPPGNWKLRLDRVIGI